MKSVAGKAYGRVREGIKECRKKKSPCRLRLMVNQRLLNTVAESRRRWGKQRSPLAVTVLRRARFLILINLECLSWLDSFGLLLGQEIVLFFCFSATVNNANISMKVFFEQ